MSRSARTGAGVAVAILAVLAAVWLLVLRDTAPAAPTLDDAVAQLDDEPSESLADDAETEAVEEPVTSVEGTWAVDRDAGGDEVDTGTYVGYRVTEELRNIGEKSATGRSPEVEGSLTIVEGRLTAVDLTVDMTTLESDSGLRDGAIATRGIEYSRFPTSTFALTEAVTIPDAALDGESFEVTVVGDLTLHGVTNEISLPLAARFVANRMVVVGTVTIVMADYDITPPKAGPVLEISDAGELEIQLFLKKA